MIFSIPKLSVAELEVIGQDQAMRQTRGRYSISTPGRCLAFCDEQRLPEYRHSNSIEGINVTRDDAMAAVRTTSRLPRKSQLAATLGYRKR